MAEQFIGFEKCHNQLLYQGSKNHTNIC